MVGKKIVVRDVISRSTGIIARRPSLILLQAIPIVFIFLGVLFLSTLFPSPSVFNPLRLVTEIVSYVLWVIVNGAYPSIIKNVLDGGQLSMIDALRKAYHRFWALLVAAVLFGVLVVLGWIALAVPGLIFGTWSRLYGPGDNAGG